QTCALPILVVPSLTPTPAAVGTTAPSATKPLNLNTASEAELETLPGIGPVTAQRIVRYREESGGFTSAEQLRTLKLVNEARLATQNVLRLRWDDGDAAVTALAVAV